MPRVLLYQPYYSDPGHFRDFFRLYFDHLAERGSACHGILGVNDEMAASEPRSATLFKRSFPQRRLRMLDNITGLRKLLQAAKASNQEVDAIQLLDVEIILLTIFVFFNRRYFKKKRVVVNLHSINHLSGNNKGVLRTMYAALVKRGYRYLERTLSLRVVTNGAFLTEFMVTHGFLKDQTVITSAWGSPDLQKELAPELKEDHTFLFLGMIRKDKNPEYLLDQFSKVDGACKLIIAGMPRDYTRQQMQQMIEYSGIDRDKLELYLDYLSTDRMYELYNRARYLVLPYTKSNVSSSGPLVTALQFNCIPIASDYGQRAQIIRQYQCGHLFGLDEEDALSRLVEELLQQNRNPLTSEIKEAKRNHQWGHIISRLVDDGLYAT